MSAESTIAMLAHDALKQPLPNLWPALALALGFPLLMLVLNEAISGTATRRPRLSRVLRSLRNLVAPALATDIFVRFVLEWPADSTAVQLVSTVFWLSLLYALLGFLNEILFASADEGSWQARVPTLFTDVLRIMLVAVGATVIYSQVWGQEIEGALTALGLGSVVIGLALQEPLGNLVSGLMLMFERPVQVGDWVNVNDVTGKVIEINWRSVHIQTPTRELRIVPNVELYKGAFSNLSRPTDVRTETLEIGLSYDDAPNRVKAVLTELLLTTPGVLREPGPLVRTVNYADFSIIYRLIFSVARQEELHATRDAIMTRLWYVVRREGLTIPYPIAMEYAPDESPSRPAPQPSALLNAHPRFRPALREDRAEQVRVMDYAAGETIQHAGQRFEGFALLVHGRAQLLTSGPQGAPAVVGELGPGDCFGGQLRAGSALDEPGVVAIDDVRLMVFEHTAIADLLNQAPGLASELGAAMELRVKAAQAARQI
jgi:small-conductance mechanosensitive channel